MVTGHTFFNGKFYSKKVFLTRERNFAKFWQSSNPVVFFWDVELTPLIKRKIY